MALQLGALRDALIDAGARPEMAGKAAEELAAYDDQFEELRRENRGEFGKVQDQFTKVQEQFAKVQEQFAHLDIRLSRFAERVEGQFARIHWMMGTLIVLVAAVLGRLLFIH
ncbi:MAG: hypothetical protein WBQ75_01910 [Acetobacteraceae bacterium]